MDPLLERALEIVNRARSHERTESALDEGSIIEPSHPNARPVYWEAVDGRILGPAKPELLAMVQAGATASFWVIVTYGGVTRWINAERLRSRNAFEELACHPT